MLLYIDLVRIAGQACVGEVRAWDRNMEQNNLKSLSIRLFINIRGESTVIVIEIRLDS